MESRVVTFGGYAVLIVVAAAIVGASLRAEEAKPAQVQVKAEPAAPEVSEEEAKEVVCAVCGEKHPEDEMYLLALESLGYAPDSMPVAVCSEACGEKALEDPEKYRNAAIAEPRERDSAE